MVIADTSSLNYLVLIGVVDVLPELFGEVVIPQAVVEELQRSRTPEPVRKWMELPPSWLKVESVTAPEGDEALQALGPGEREALALAQGVPGARLIIDERDGRREAERRGVAVTGLLGVLDDAGEWGLIDVSESLRALEATTFRASARLFQLVRDREAERKQRSIEQGRLEPSSTEEPSPENRNRSRGIER